jgi:hypothetical protein
MSPEVAPIITHHPAEQRCGVDVAAAQLASDGELEHAGSGQRVDRFGRQPTGILDGRAERGDDGRRPADSPQDLGIGEGHPCRLRPPWRGVTPARSCVVRST